MVQGNDAPTTLRPAVQSLVAKSPRLFPTELLHEVIILTLSRYLSDVLIAPATTRTWDAIGALLHVNYHFRACTLSVLNALWGGNFMDYKRGQPRNYTHKIKYLRELAELAQTNPVEIFPPKRHVLSMCPNIAPYERLGRYFVIYRAQVNMSLAKDGCCDLYDDLTNLTLGFSELPMWLRGRVLGEFADYVVSNLIGWMRALSFRELAREAARSINLFSEHNIVTDNFEDRVHYARRCMRKVSEVAGSLGWDEDGDGCEVLSLDAVSRDLCEALLPQMRSLQTKGGTGGAISNAWMLTLGVFLTSKERKTYGIASAASRDD